MDEILHAPQNELPLRRRRKDHSPSGAERVERFPGAVFQVDDRDRPSAAGSCGSRAPGSTTGPGRPRRGSPSCPRCPSWPSAPWWGWPPWWGTVYTPLLCGDGRRHRTWAWSRNQAIFTQAMDRVEDRASEILGYEYQMEHTVSYTPALSERSELTPVADFENYLFDQISEITQGYVLDGGRPDGGRRHGPGRPGHPAGGALRPLCQREHVLGVLHQERPHHQGVLPQRHPAGHGGHDGHPHRQHQRADHLRGPEGRHLHGPGLRQRHDHVRDGGP